MKFGTIDMLPNNPFYILGLPCEASQRQIRRRREDLEAAYSLGDAAWKKEFPYLLKGSQLPTLEMVKEAFVRLGDSATRLVSSYYWFWAPREDDGNKFKLVFDTFLSGDLKAAENSWLTLFKEAESTAHGICSHGFAAMQRDPVALENFERRCNKKVEIRVCAQHNLGVLCRLRAMILECLLRNNAISIEPDVLDELSSCWHMALRRERTEYADCKFYVESDSSQIFDKHFNVFKAQEFIADDSQISTDLLNVLALVIRDLPMFWQLRYVAAYARKDDENNIKRHVDLIKQEFGRASLSGDVLGVFIGEMADYHVMLIKRLDEHVNVDNAEGLKAANELFDATSKNYDAVHAIFDPSELKKTLQKKQLELARCRRADGTCGKADNQTLAKIEKEISLIEMHLRFASDTYDPVVQAYLRYIIKYSDVTKDWKIAIEWDELLSKLAVSDKLKETVNKDLRSIFKVRLNDLIEHCLAEVKADSKLGLWAVQELFEKSKELLKTLDARYGASSEIIKEARNNIAGIGRVFLVAYGNATADWSACLKWIKELRAIAEDAKVVALLESDQKTVLGNVQQALAEKRIISMSRPRNEVSPAANIGWVVVLVIITVVMIGVYKESKHKEIEHSRYVPTKAHVTRVEEWERVRKTKSGMVKSREPYYKVYYEYLVGNKTYVDSKRQSKMPENFITVYYDPEKPGNSTTKRHKSLGSLVGMVLAILISMVLIPINIIMFCKKMRKQCGNYDG